VAGSIPQPLPWLALLNDALRRSPTLVDIARAAGVSRTTASAALGGKGRIAPATRDHVRVVAERLGYVANPTARHLRTGRKSAIGVYIAENLFAYAFYMEYIFGIADALRHEGVAVTLMSASAGRMPGTAMTQVDGVIIADPIVHDPVVRQLLESGLPVVCAERHLDAGVQPLVTIETDYQAAERELLDHMWERGARAPALLTIPTEISFIRSLEQGYRDWCNERGIQARLSVLDSGPEPQIVSRQARELLDGPDAPDAILTAADGTALGVVGAAAELGLVVGTDLLVGSCSDSAAMRLVTPGITAIEAPPREVGRDSADVLLRLLRGEHVPATIQRPRPSLALRESTLGPRR
jgi:DNA-binding LacI/PurR family transcriptional regulator